MKVLLAVDGSDASLRATSYAAKLLTELKSGSITLISVHDDMVFNVARKFVSSKLINDYLRELSDNDLASARTLLDQAEIKHDMVIRVGHLSQEIVNCANEGGYDMIMMGSKGRAGIADIVLGSVAQRVLTMAKQPVLLVK